MSKHTHRWRQVHEEIIIIGGSTPIGWECTVKGCKEWYDTPPARGGLPGIVTTAHRLIGPHGGNSRCSDGTTYKEQIIHEDGRLEIRR